MALQHDRPPSPDSDTEDGPLLSTGFEYPPTIEARRTPLPRFQLSILFYLTFCQGAALNSIFPFESELLLRFTAGDEGKVAYYASIMDACRGLAGLVPVLYLSRISDHIGRKPILILSLTTLVVSTILLGLSTTFWEVVASRCLSSLLSNIEASVNTSIGELTDETNRAEAFAPLVFSFVLGASTGSLMSGYLANPSKRFPRLFGGKLWQKFPYLLPCGASSFLCAIALFSICLRFRETLRRREKSCRKPGRDSPSLAPIWSLLTSRVIFTIATAVAFNFFLASFTALQPLFLGTGIPEGGFGLQPMEIGSLMFIYGLATSVIQTFCLGPLIRKFGLRAVLTAACLSYVPTFLLVPLTNCFARDWLATESRLSYIFMQTFLVLLYACSCFSGFGYSCLSIYITSSAPNQQSLGSINGLTQLPVELSRLIGSSFATFVLGLSIRREWMGENAVYYILSVMAFGCVALTIRLPRDGWHNAQQGVTEGLDSGDRYYAEVLL